MATTSLHALTSPLRTHGAVLFDGYPEPHAEVMALVWGPRFDREHAQALLQRRPACAAQVLPTVQHAADQFDQLGSDEQRRVRQLIARHRSRWDNAPSTS